MAHDLPGNYDWQLILLAKQQKNFTALGAPDVTNWGQFKQYVKEKQTNPDKGHNLGGVMSGRETPVASSTPPPALTLSTTGITGGTSVPELELQNNNGQGNGYGNNQSNHKNNKGGNGDVHGNSEGKGKNK